MRRRHEVGVFDWYVAALPMLAAVVTAFAPPSALWRLWKWAAVEGKNHAQIAL